MRCNLCSVMHRLLYSTFVNPGPSKVEEMADVVVPFRRCLNIKARKSPDVQCAISATHGDYCSRHYKNPRPFRSITVAESRAYTRSHTIAVRRIQKFWRRIVPLRRYSQQGPAANLKGISVNATELYSFEPISVIPSYYLISVCDEKKLVWVFDIRTIVHTMATGFPSQNPYTRGSFTDLSMKRIHARIAWLRRRKYHILHANTDILTQEQCWNQKVLDAILKIEALGYYVSCEWFTELTKEEHMKFYRRLYSIWNWRLNLTRAEKEAIVPQYDARPCVFRFSPNDQPEKSVTWWERYTLSIVEAFTTRSSDREQQKLGALYILMALVQVSKGAAEGLPWLSDFAE